MASLPVACSLSGPVIPLAPEVTLACNDDHDAGILLTQLWHWSNGGSRVVTATLESTFRATRLSERSQRRARKILDSLFMIKARTPRGAGGRSHLEIDVFPSVITEAVERARVKLRASTVPGCDPQPGIVGENNGIFHPGCDPQPGVTVLGGGVIPGCDPQGVRVAIRSVDGDPGLRSARGPGCDPQPSKILKDPDPDQDQERSKNPPTPQAAVPEALAGSASASPPLPAWWPELEKNPEPSQEAQQAISDHDPGIATVPALDTPRIAAGASEAALAVETQEPEQQSLLAAKPVTEEALLSGEFDSMTARELSGSDGKRVLAGLIQVWRTHWNHPRATPDGHQKIWVAWVKAGNPPGDIAKAIIGMRHDESPADRNQHHGFSHVFRSMVRFCSLYESHHLSGVAPRWPKTTVAGCAEWMGIFIPRDYEPTEIDKRFRTNGDHVFVISERQWVDPATDRKNLIQKHREKFGDVNLTRRLLDRIEDCRRAEAIRLTEAGDTAGELFGRQLRELREQGMTFNQAMAEIDRRAAMPPLALVANG